MSKEIRTEVETGEFKGNEVITIWEIDDEGKRKQFPLLSVGRKKAQAILDNIEKIDAWLNYK